MCWLRAFSEGLCDHSSDAQTSSLEAERGIWVEGKGGVKPLMRLNHAQVCTSDCGVTRQHGETHVSTKDPLKWSHADLPGAMLLRRWSSLRRWTHVLWWSAVMSNYSLHTLVMSSIPDSSDTLIDTRSWLYQNTDVYDDKYKYWLIQWHLSLSVL